MYLEQKRTILSHDELVYKNFKQQLEVRRVGTKQLVSFGM